MSFAWALLFRSHLSDSASCLRKDLLSAYCGFRTHPLCTNGWICLSFASYLSACVGFHCSSCVCPSPGVRSHYLYRSTAYFSGTTFFFFVKYFMSACYFLLTPSYSSPHLRSMLLSLAHVLLPCPLCTLLTFMCLSPPPHSFSPVCSP